MTSYFQGKNDPILTREMCSAHICLFDIYQLPNKDPRVDS